jgi:type I restriction enzyme, R subunit
VGHQDEARFQEHRRGPSAQARVIERFLNPEDGLSLLVVCDMLLTGFDAPIEQVMYLDAPLREHTLLQAIARVNRKAEGKKYGLVVDYWGVSGALQEALALFSPQDVQGALRPKFDELPRLRIRHREALRFFDKVRDKEDLDGCVRVLEPEDARAGFDQAFRAFSESLDMLLPDPRALPYVDDLRWLGKIRKAARSRFRDERLDVRDCGAKVRQLIEESVIAEGIQLLVKEVPLFGREFEEKLEALGTPEARASEMEHALRHEIHVKLEENPAFYGSLRERLERLVEERKQQRLDAVRQLELFQGMKRELEDEGGTARRAGLSELAFAIYGALEEGEPPRVGEGEGEYAVEWRELSTRIEEALAPGLGLLDWESKEDVQREMRQRVKKRLREARYGEGPEVEAATARIMALARARRRR